MPSKNLDPFLATLGKRIRDVRKDLGWSQEDLAEAANLDRSYIGGIERGERNISFTILCKLAGALRRDVGALTLGIPPKRKSTSSSRRGPRDGT
jgi:transcriptional regulator with XRE-family HTH domain